MTDFAYDPRPEAGLTTVAIPAGIDSKAALFEAFGPILPGWFGDNFDALNDVLGGAGEGLRIIHADVPLSGDAQRIYLEILEDSGCVVVFPAACRAAVEEALT